MSAPRTDCGCGFVNTTAIMCAPHYAMLSEALDEETQTVPALLRLVERIRAEDEL